MMQAWISPAIIAVIVSALITAAGWFVTYRNSLGLEKERRREKIRDFQIALRAEIRSELHHLDEDDLLAGLQEIEGRYAKSKTYSVLVTGIPKHIIFENLAKEIHILPETVIDPVILYARQRQVAERLIDDMRSERFRLSKQEQQIALYRDYIQVLVYLTNLAQESLKAIDEALNDRM